MNCQAFFREGPLLPVNLETSSGTTVNPRVSVILACRNEVHSIVSCVEGILAQEDPGGGFELIIADGMSDDGTRDLLENLAAANTSRVRPDARPGIPVRLIDNPGRIVSTGLNAAIRIARGEIIVRVDAHTEYAPDYLKCCVECLERTGADNVGGPARTRADGYSQKAIAAAYHSAFAVGGARFHDVDYEGYVDTVTYGCWQRSAFQRYGYFDENLVRNQDDEHNLRIIRGGGRVWQSPRIRSWYKPRASLKSLFHQYAQYGYWKVRVIRKHRLPASVRHLIPGLYVAFLVAGAGLVAGLALAASLARTTGGNPEYARALAMAAQWGGGMWLAVVATYALAVLAASILTASRNAWGLFPMLLLVFPCYHLGYGWGFLRGVLHAFRRTTEVEAFTRTVRDCPGSTR